MAENMNWEHGPENAEHEIRKAYNLTIESGLAYFWDRRSIPGVHPEEVPECYKTAYQAYRDHDRLAAERWARTAKHLARAFWHEAKISYLEEHVTDLPILQGATAAEYRLHEYSDTTDDLIHSVADHVPPGMTRMPDRMQRYVLRARWHLQMLDVENYTHELLRAERIKAAHEYGRVLECMALAYEAQNAKKKVA